MEGRRSLMVCVFGNEVKISGSQREEKCKNKPEKKKKKKGTKPQNTQGRAVGDGEGWALGTGDRVRVLPALKAHGLSGCHRVGSSWAADGNL